jgi:dihydrofolate reductase
VAHGGAGFVRSLSTLRLVDEYRLLVHPVVLGSGLRMFADPMELRLVSATAFDGGAVAHVYRPA